jgi:type III secretory pathway component EscT
MKFIELCIRTQYETLKLPSDQMLKITSECLLHIKEVSKAIYIACVIANPLSIMISKLPLRVQRKILDAPLIKSLKQLILVTSMMRIMRHIVDVKVN